MTDWAGNEFVPGDIMVSVLIKHPDLISPPLLYNEETGHLEPARVTIVEGLPEWVWNPYLETDIVDHEGTTMMVLTNYETGKEFLCPLHLAQEYAHRFVFFCKKGVSDNEEAFFKHYFKPNMN